MQAKNRFYSHLRFKLLIVALCAILMLVPGLFITRPAQASDPARAANLLNGPDFPIDQRLAIVAQNVKPNIILQVFNIKDSDGTLWVKTSSNGAWGNWATLGKPHTIYNISSIDAVSWGGNRLDVFAYTASGPGFSGANIWHIFWNGPGTAWSDWQQFPLPAPPFKELQAVSWGPGRLDVFSGQAEAPNGNPLLHRWFDGSWLPNFGPPTYAGWEAIEQNPAPSSGSLHVESWGANRLDLFKRAWDHKIYHKYFNGSWNPSAGGWNYLYGESPDTPYAVSWGPNRLDVFVRGMDGAVYTNGSPNGGSSWYGWYYLGGGGSTSYKAPTAASWAANRLDVFENRSGNVYHKWWNGSAWEPSSDWEWIGSTIFSNPPKVVSTRTDRLNLFGRASDGTVYHKQWNGSTWLPSVNGAWESIGKP